MKKHRVMQFGQSDVEKDAPVDPAIVSVDPAVVIRKLDRHLIPWLFALGILCYLDRTNLSFAALDLNRDLQLSCSTYGLGASLFFVSYALFQMPLPAGPRSLQRLEGGKQEGGGEDGYLGGVKAQQASGWQHTQQGRHQRVRSGSGASEVEFQPIQDSSKCFPLMNKYGFTG
ncbi:hypothetical protein D9Q98_007555 [Chlorella vulgaris]|uniref:Uncharacterized protein n=1 Tax=Chlorella vulgaris TaxID=3077 RepID=A0A9D4TLC0_CHLVU|nr:hypothetical protein D9Q98_007555 [Chlorella vulgaris]